MPFLKGSSSQSCYVRLICALALLCAGWIRADSANPTEYEVKAAFLFNFAKFVEFPVSKLAGPGDPIVLGILGEDPFGSDLEKTVQGKKIGNREFLVRRIKGERLTEKVQMLFICGSERRRLDRVLESLKGTGTLTVSDMDQFCDRGGMIGFKMEASKVRFEINQAAAEAEGLKPSSKLLSVSMRVLGR